MKAPQLSPGPSTSSAGSWTRQLGASLAQLVFAEGEAAQEKLNDTTYAQPALFAVEVALFRMFSALGLKPDLLAGHSIGELSAAHVSGVLSLRDAARLVVARGRLMGELPAGGAMLAVATTEAEASEAIEGRGEALSIAAINSPRSVVLSGKEEAVAELEARWEAKKSKRLVVSHAFHSPLMEPMLERFAEVAESLDYSAPKIPIVSGLSGELSGAEQAEDPAYWVSQARRPVRFADVVATLREQGASALVEIGPHPTLIPMAEECLAGQEPGERPVGIPTLRRERPEPGALAAMLARASAAGVQLDLPALFEGTDAKRVPLPTYPFQRQRFWLESGIGVADPTALGQAPVEHPVLGAVVELAGAEGESLLLTGRISLQSHPWLADHAVDGSVIVPGTVFTELALQAGERVGAERISALNFEAPLILPESGAVQLQVAVSEPDERGRRPIAAYSRPEGDTIESEVAECEWTRHASGSLSTPDTALAPQRLASWPPPGAAEIDLTDFYGRLAGIGFEYGPAFQCLTAAWRDGEEIYAEVSLAPEQHDEAGAFAIHPALLDAALHSGLVAFGDRDPELRALFGLSEVSLAIAGVRELRVKLSWTGEGSAALALFDSAGVEVAGIGSMLTRSITPEQLVAAGRHSKSLHEIRWSEVELRGEELRVVARLGDGGFESLEAQEDSPELILWQPDVKGEPPAAARSATEAALETIQAFLAAERLAESRLVLLTERAVAVSGEESPELSLASLWGLLRSAQSEHPGRFALIDSDGSEASLEALPAAAAQGEEPQLALREGRALAPRVARAASAPAGENEQGTPLDPQKTVLISGGTGAMAAHIARHLVEEHGARRLLLVSRSGAKAEGAKELKAELAGLGAKAKLAACDVSDPEALEALLAKVPKAHPLGAVIHAAGTLEDGTIESLDPESVDRVFAPKATAAWHLHELTEDADLDAFVLFSSAAGSLGSPGQANYAAANVFCDALAARRRAEGLPATSIAWGAWLQRSGLTAELGEADVARLRRVGVEPLTDEQGLELFDASLASALPLCLAIGVNHRGLRAMAAAGALPPLFSGLVRAPARRASQGSLATKLASLPEAEREGHVLELIRSEVAAVLGHGSASEVDPDRAFKEMGFDSLAAVELKTAIA